MFRPPWCVEAPLCPCSHREAPAVKQLLCRADTETELCTFRQVHPFPSGCVQVRNTFHGLSSLFHKAKLGDISLGRLVIAMNSPVIHNQPPPLALPLSAQLRGAATHRALISSTRSTAQLPATGPPAALCSAPIGGPPGSTVFHKHLQNE